MAYRIKLDTHPDPTDRSFGEVEQAADYLIDNHRSLSTHFLEAVEDSEVDGAVIVAFAKRSHEANASATTHDPSLADEDLPVPYRFLGALLELVAEGDYSAENRAELDNLVEQALAFEDDRKTASVRPPGWWMGKVYRARHSRQEEEATSS